MRRFISGGLLLAGLVVAGCGSDSSGPDEPGANEILMTATTFSPANKTTTVGTTITWRNVTSIQHDITPNNPGQAGAWVKKVISGTGATFSHTFNTAGVYDYNCTLHAGMNGRITVN
jgi:plastocyanin